MLLVVLICALTISCRANPFHKYPFVFLLDIGNEELGKANTEQIKVTVPGGALAIKYPATGQGDIIGHVRVTGIDYGTDLKANIVEGGPGYRYVVLVFMGNDVEYDAVVTIQTLSDDDVNTRIGMSGQSSYEVKEDELNDSAEEIDDGPPSNSVYSEKMNAEFTQSSSNVYRYVKNENMEVHSQENVSNDDGGGDHDDDDDDDDGDGDEVNKAEIVNIESENHDVEQDELDTKDNLEQSHNDEEAEDNDDDKDDNDDDDENKVNNLNTAYVSNVNSVPHGFVYPANIHNQELRDPNPNPEVTYKLVGGPERYFALRPRFYGRVYPQLPVPEDRSYIDHSEDNLVEGQAKDTNNNVNDYISPVEY